MTVLEDQLIERIRRGLPSSPGGALLAGIGDDAALLTFSRRQSRAAKWVVTTDQFIERVHFLGDVHPPEAVGYKALARATSDIAAMGAQPRLFFLSLSLPSRRAGQWLDQMLAGMARAARLVGLKLAGGDTARAPSAGGGVALNMTVLGEMQPSVEPVLRSGARPGDIIFVTGRLGAAQLGLEVILRRLHNRPRWQPLLRPHHYPEIHVRLGQWLAAKRLASAMMDLSDGLSTDLGRLCRESDVGALLFGQQIPRVAVPARLPFQADPLELAVHGGEDYGLLFTVPRRLTTKISPASHGAQITPIGEIVRGPGVVLEDANGSTSPLVPKGWDHFG